MPGRCVILGKLVPVRRSFPRAHNDAIEVLVLESADFELPKIGATACLMVICILFSIWCRDGSCPHLFYQYGAKVLPQALFGCCRLVPSWNVNSLFESEGVTCASKCIRKVALCHIKQEEYAQALAVICLCPGDEAATHYLTFLVAVKQGKKYLSGLRAMTQPIPLTPRQRMGK